MGKNLYPEESVQAIADAIRTKDGKADKMTVGEMSEGIAKIDLNSLLVKYVQGSLTEIIFHGTNINHKWGFYSTTNLETLVLTANSVAILSDASMFSNNTKLSSIYVPDDLVDSYKTTTNWSTYTDLIKPMSERES